MAASQPADEFRCIADRGRQQQQSHVFRQESQRQLPHDTALPIGEVVKLVHHDGRDIGEVERRRVQQAVQQDFRHHDQHPRLRVDPPVAGDQPDVIGSEPPADGGLLHLLKLLLGQRDQRRGVVSHATGVQRLEQCGFGNQRFAGPRRCTHQNALLGREPR